MASTGTDTKPAKVVELTGWSGPTVPRNHPLVKAILEATFPEYRGRKIQLRLWTKPRYLSNYWDGGSRSYWRLVNIATGTVSEPMNDNPFQASAHADVDLPQGHLFVEHCIFQGHDIGIRIYGRQESTTALIAPVLALQA